MLDLVSSEIQSDAIIHLPPPRTSGGAALADALMARRSARAFSGKPLPPQVLSDLLWSAAGINREDTGGRTAASARNWREIDVYVALEGGTFVFEPDTHRLRRVAEHDLRAQTGSQDFVADAPLNLVYVADLAKVTATEPIERRFYCAADAALIAGNVYLYCAGAGLATVMRGLIDRPALARAMGLDMRQRVIFAQSVGYPAGG